MKKNKMEIHHAETIEEAIDTIEEYFQADMWYAKNTEWKTEKDMLKYLNGHFDILRNEIDRIIKKKSTKIEFFREERTKKREKINKRKSESYLKAKEALSRLRVRNT